MADKILDELKKATEQVQAIASTMEAEQRSEYLEAFSQQFFELQKTVHSIISEKGIILNNFKWEEYEVQTDIPYIKYIEKEAELFADKYGFSKQVVLELVQTQNKGYAKKRFRILCYYMLVPKE